MKVYVCYFTAQWEGCSSPVAAFSTKEQAEEYCEKYETDNDWCNFEELELNKETK